MLEVKFGPIDSYLGVIGANLTLERGETLGLVGPNGIGKSTFFRFLKRFQKECFPSQSTVFMDQFPLSPLGRLTARHLVEMLQHFKDCKYLAKELEHMPCVQDLDFVKKIDKPIETLSGGENQIVKWMACLNCKADVYFFDEPFNHLDTDKVNYFEREFKKLQSHQKYIFLIEHSYERIQKLCHNIVNLKNRENVLSLTNQDKIVVSQWEQI